MAAEGRFIEEVDDIEREGRIKKSEVASCRAKQEKDFFISVPRLVVKLVGNDDASTRNDAVGAVFAPWGRRGRHREAMCFVSCVRGVMWDREGLCALMLLRLLFFL